jgi:hypothetical protein
MSRPAIHIGLNAYGRIVIGITAGCCQIERELSEAEATAFADMLAAQRETSRRVQQLQLPWIHDEGQA